MFEEQNPIWKNTQQILVPYMFGGLMLHGLLRPYPYAAGYILKMGTSVFLKKLIIIYKTLQHCI